MKWRTKARVQNLIAALPGPLAQFFYYRMQRSFGGLRAPTPVKRIEAGFTLARALRPYRSLTGASVMEVGTGRSLGLPLVCWLLGAERVITVDVTVYLRPEILRSDLAYCKAHKAWLRDLLAQHEGGSGAANTRLDELLELELQVPARQLLDEVLQRCCITYLAPCDASAPDLQAGSLDVQLSRAVLEHIPPDELRRLLEGATRLLKPDGHCAHWIDLSDHFQHGDDSISRINFLRFTDAGWERLAGNRFMYMNRLRASQYLALFADSGLEVLNVQGVVDEEGRALVESGELPLAAKFRQLSASDLATTSQLVVASPMTGRDTEI